MKKIIFVSALLVAISGTAQTYQLKVTNRNTSKISYIREGNKVLFAVKVPSFWVSGKPAHIYKLSAAEISDSVFWVTKARIRSITDSTLLLKERNSLFSSTIREIRTNQINTIRKLSTGQQIFRTSATVSAGLAAGVTLFYSYAAVGACDGCLQGMFYAAGITGVTSRFGRTKISKRQFNGSVIETVAAP